MCTLIIQGKPKNLSVESGINIRVTPEGDAEDRDTYIFKTSGPGKYYPGPPSCLFHGKDIPALMQWNKSGSITSGIIIEALTTLDVKISSQGMTTSTHFYYLMTMVVDWRCHFPSIL